MLEIREVANLKTGVGELGWKWLISDVLTEENTDILIGMVDKLPLPWYGRFIRGFIKKKLDAKLPELLIDIIKKVIVSRGILTQAQIDAIEPWHNISSTGYSG